MLTLQQYLLSQQGDSAPDRPWPSPPREPLPTFPQQTLPYITTLTQTPPNKPDRDWWRGNAWCRVVPGAPYVEGADKVHPDRVLTYLLDRYDGSWRTKIVDEHVRASYTHFTLSWPDSHRNGNGQSVSDYVSMSQAVQRRGFYMDHFLTSKIYDAGDMSADQFMAHVDPVLTTLLESGAADIITVGWEWNLWNTNIPGEVTHQIFGEVGKRCAPYGVPVYVHFSTHYTSWQSNDGTEDRWQFWRRHNPKNAGWANYMGPLRGLKYQSDPSWSFNEMQGRIGDTTNRPQSEEVGWGHEFNFVAWETFAYAQFESVSGPNEADGDQAGFITSCTPGVASVAGYGNGGRRPDGSAL